MEENRNVDPKYFRAFNDEEWLIAYRLLQEKEGDIDFNRADYYLYTGGKRQEVCLWTKMCLFSVCAFEGVVAQLAEEKTPTADEEQQAEEVPAEVETEIKRELQFINN